MSPPVWTLDTHHQKDFPRHHAKKCGYDALKARLDRATERMNRAKVQMDALAKAVKQIGTT